jgi:hypothetical protein
VFDACGLIWGLRVSFWASIPTNSERAVYRSGSSVDHIFTTVQKQPRRTQTEY